MKRLIGVDNSVNSPGIVEFLVDDDFEIVSKFCMGFTQVKKNEGKNITHFKKKNFNNPIHQYTWMRDIISGGVLFGALPTYVAIEDYAFAAKGKVFNLAEACGALKVALYESGCKIRLYDPGSIKKYATQYGDADKIRMREEFEALPEENRFPIDEVNEDIIDAFWICKLLQTELKIRHGLLQVKDLTPKQIEVFNRCTKAYPENILVRPFMQKEETC